MDKSKTAAERFAITLGECEAKYMEAASDAAYWRDQADWYRDLLFAELAGTGTPLERLEADFGPRTRPEKPPQ